ncbi:hypothetical protein QR680_006133 [Steinernema hermaphroditum]|uniref:Uncharacterized protein n=1 Tax=Steinernema hermaphroditum TaxID=289476 RepID=A0AA39HUI5_9BILA|nr:hypothetical protein QR680_006133 [Steinernema hermaphroditum]
METRLLGAMWLLLAGVFLFYGTSAQTIKIVNMQYDEYLQRYFGRKEYFDRCPQYNFRNNFYHALTCAGERRVYYPATKQFQFSGQGSYFNLETKKHTLVHLCTPPGPEHPFRQVDPMMSKPRPVLLKESLHFPYRHMKYYNQIYNQHSIFSFNDMIRSYTRSKYYAVIVYKNDEKERKLFDQKKARHFAILEPCYIRVIRPDLHESHEMLMTPYSVSHKFVIPDVKAPRLITTTTTTTTTPRTTPAPKARKTSPLTTPAITTSTTTTTTATTTPVTETIGVMQLVLPQRNHSREYNLSAVSFVSLIIAGLVFYV